MSNLLDLLVAGLATGAIYALVAVGFTLLWQTSQTINFAQGEFVMLPAFLMLAAMHVGVPFWLAILIGMLLSMLLLGLGFKLLLVDPMLRHGVLPLAIATMALAIGMKEAVKQFISAEASPFPSIVPAGDVSLLGRVVSLQSLGVLALAIAVVIGLTALLNRVVDNLAAAYVSTQYRAAVPLILLIVIILFRPQGLLGRPEERTV